jgi:hypothetical protein
MEYQSRRISIYISSLIIVLLQLSGCTPNMENPEQTPATLTPSALLPAIANTPSPVPTNDTNPTPTKPSSTQILLKEKCPPIEEEISPDINLSGVWIRNRANPLLENLEERVRYKVPLEGGAALDAIFISPDGMLLAYLDRFVGTNGRGTDKWELKILKSNGHLILLKNWVFDVREILGWANNSEVVLKIYSKGTKYILYNPFSGGWSEIIINYNVVRNPYVNDLILRPWPNHYFHPRKMFFTTVDGIAFYNLETWKKILDVDFGYTAKITWSPDLSRVLVVPSIDRDSQNLYLIENDEIALKLNIINAGLAANRSEVTYHVLWSPDGRKFVIRTSSKLAIMNLDTLELKGICLDDWASHISGFWSPDSQFIVTHYSGYGDTGSYEYYDILLDTKTMRTFKLSTTDRYEYRIGWLASP